MLAPTAPQCIIWKRDPQFRAALSDAWKLWQQAHLARYAARPRRHDTRQAELRPACQEHMRRVGQEGLWRRYGW